MKALATSDIQNFIETYPFLYNSFKGFFNFNTFSPVFIREGEFVIFHTPSLNSVDIGHWTLLLQNNDKYEYFDSTGETFKNLPHFLSILRQHYPVISNSFPIQARQSVSCGHFCLYYISHRILYNYMSYIDFMTNYFSDSITVNEQNITHFAAQNIKS